MSNTTTQSDELSLSIGDRLNYPYLTGKQILALIEMQSKREELTEEVIKIPIKALLNMIPTRLRDEDFTKDLKEAIKNEDVDIRPNFAGRKMDKELCEELKVPVSENREVMDPFKTLNAIFNLFQRRKMLLRVNWVEVVTGEPYDPEWEKEAEAVLSEED